MKSWSKWSAAVAIGALSMSALVAAFNVLVDPYSVFRTNEGMRSGYNPNERYRKVEHLKKSIGQHDSFVMGASTMGLYPMEIFKEVRPEGRWYNLSFLSGTPAEALRVLKYLKDQGEPIKEIVYGIDMFSFRQLAPYKELWRQEHPDISGESWYSWWKKHVFASTLLDGIERLTHNWMNDKPRVVFDLEGTGSYRMVRWEREIERDEGAFIRKQLVDKQPKPAGEISAAEITLIDARFDELKELKDWLDLNGVKSHFWINPMQWRQMQTIHDRTMAEYRRKVFAAIGQVPDFTTRDDICSNDRAFLDLQHYRPKVAERLVREVLGGSNVITLATTADASRRY